MYRTESVVNDLNIKRIKAHLLGTISFALNRSGRLVIREMFAPQFGVPVHCAYAGYHRIKVDKDARNNNMQMQI